MNAVTDRNLRRRSRSEGRQTGSRLARVRVECVRLDRRGAQHAPVVQNPLADARVDTHLDAALRAVKDELTWHGDHDRSTDS